MIGTYLCVGAGWAASGALLQLKKSSSKSMLFQVIALNLLAWPFMMVYAYIQSKGEFAKPE